jgi:hypothetical protein
MSGLVWPHQFLMAVLKDGNGRNAYQQIEHVIKNTEGV